MASPWPSGAANSTNSKPSMPIGFSNVVTVMPRFGPWLVCGCALMGGLLGDVATRHRCGGAACIGWPAVIVSDETICKAQRSMPDDLFTAGTAPSHAVLDLERFLPYRMSVLRTEEHTSELQSLMRISSAVFCLKKTKLKHLTSNP